MINPETLIEANKFKTQMLVCSIMCWLLIIFLEILNPDRPLEFVILFAAVVLTFIYVKMKCMIARYNSEDILNQNAEFARVITKSITKSK